MPDAIFDHPRLAAVYDAFDADRRDLDAYLGIVAELGARRVLDFGCGTGVLALALAARGIEVIGVDPAAGSIEVARAKAGADRVRWILGDAGALPRDLAVDTVTMTGNAAQAIVDVGSWRQTLVAVHDALRPGGCFVVETRDPARRAWEDWTPEWTALTVEVDGVGRVRRWSELVDVAPPIVAFDTHTVFEADGARLESRSVLRFREREEVESNLADAGLATVEVRDAPDRPGLEFVFLARRAD